MIIWGMIEYVECRGERGRLCRIKNKRTTLSAYIMPSDDGWTAPDIDEELSQLAIVAADELGITINFGEPGDFVVEYL